MILDGWGLGTNPNVSAIDKANTPYIDSLYHDYPNSKLVTYGSGVGLPEGQMGNSEVGHMNLGAGRIVYQDFAKINLDIQNGDFNKKQNLINPLKSIKKNNKKLHLIGLVSDGGVHSHISHLEAILDLTEEMNINDVFIHAFTDGRDVDPKSGLGFIERLEKKIKRSSAKLASVIGRYYAMDRDKRWERTKKCYDLLVNGIGTKTSNIKNSIKDSYSNNITDEFLEPLLAVNKSNESDGLIENGDYVIFFNFRTDRGRQLTQVMTQNSKNEMKKLDLNFVTMTNYDDSFENIKVIYDKANLDDTLGEVLSKNNKKQIRIAETEKYPHVTFFFNGGRETPFEGENRLMAHSPKVSTYDLQPEMSAEKLVDIVIPEMNDDRADFICLNFANPDMVGHTGVFEAIVKAVETTDNCLSKVLEAGLSSGYEFIIIADHGNADKAKNPDGSPHTAHTTNPVPILVVSSREIEVRDGILADVAPTILDLMGIEQPSEMTGSSLI